MTQREFDQTMNGYRMAETEEKRPLQIQLDTLAAKRRAIGYEIAGLQAQLSAIAAQQSTLIREIKQIGSVRSRARECPMCAAWACARPSRGWSKPAWR